MKQGIFSSRPLALPNVEDRISSIEARHRELDARLKELGRHAYLTPSEQIEASQLKKHKLRAKDEIAALRRSLP
jgi:uncharacterized protein YdcH (DUF465 family)